MNLTYSFTPGPWLLTQEGGTLLEEIAIFYSSHYGEWSPNCPMPILRGRQVSLSSEKVSKWLNNDLAELWTVRDNDILVGYAIAIKGKSGSKENIIWVTQFVIHKKFRNTGIGKQLLLSIWGFSSFFAWGLVTANPFAVRALEKITRRRCDPERIRRNSQQILNFGNKNVSYIDEHIEKRIDSKSSLVNTKFYVDHSDVDKMLDAVITEDKPWLLGGIEEGWEWFAFTFNDQEPFELTELEINDMLAVSDSIAQQAYNRMLMDLVSQSWTNSTRIEVDYIIDKLKLNPTHSILDVGCGMGRHTIEFSKRGYNIEGIDYAKSLIDSAKSKALKANVDCVFSCVDITESNNLVQLQTNYDVIICLYDVIGSYADETKNKRILNNISSLLIEGGYAVISVMNLHLTEKKAKHKFILKESSKALLELPASHTMEETGNIFNPDFYLIDEKTKIVYRKEIFSYNRTHSNSIPIELIVRDKRYYAKEIEQMCISVGLTVVEKRFVNAGWQTDFESTSDKAKEILLVLQKRTN